MILSPLMYIWILTLLGSALFSGMEMAFISVDKLYYMVNQSETGWLKKIINRAYRQPRRFLSTLLLGNFVVLVLFSFFSLYLFYPLVVSLFDINPILSAALLIIAICVVLILSGEIIPRVIMAQKPDIWVKILILPIYIFHLLFLPFTFLYEKISLFVLSVFGVKLQHIDDNAINKADINNYLKKGFEEMSDDTEVDSEVKILRNALEFSTMRVRDCMVPRADIVAITNNADKDALKALFIETGLSRILIFNEDIDNIVGYIHVWEMFNESDNWQQNITKVSFVPESMQAAELMNELMQQHKSMAVVFDEFGGTSGLVTIEDLVEEIFGEIDDEYDDQSKFVKQYSDNEYVLSGRVEIDTINEEYGIGIPESDDYSTIAGFILNYTQRFPNLYETIIIEQFEFNVLKVSARKIEVVKLIVHPE